jgi:hypothetical protein
MKALLVFLLLSCFMIGCFATVLEESASKERTLFDGFVDYVSGFLLPENIADEENKLSVRERLEQLIEPAKEDPQFYDEPRTE